MSSCHDLGLVALLVATVSSGCDWADSGPPNPLELPAATPAVGAGGSDQPGPGNDAGAPRRSVSMRNPLGGPPGNLLYDGDFELTVGSGNLTGWSVWKYGVGTASFALETGGLCRSGTRCAVLESNMEWYGWGAAAPNAPMHASIWAKPPAARPCAAIEPAVVDWATGTGSYLEPTTEQPGEDGWCTYEAGMSRQDTQIIIVVRGSLVLDETALVDAARLVPATGTVPMAAAGRPLEPARQQHIRIMLDYFRSQRPFVPPPEPAAPVGLR